MNAVAENDFIMTRFRFLAAACLGTLFYVMVSMFAGRDGVWARNQLLEQKRILSANTASIEKTYEELSLEKVALQKDMDVIAAYARKLGYVQEGEKIVKINGLTVRETQIFDAGSVVKHEESKYVPEMYCKGVGLAVFALVYSLLLLLDYTRGLLKVGSKKKYYDELKGIPA